MSKRASTFTLSQEGSDAKKSKTTEEDPMDEDDISTINQSWQRPDCPKMQPSNEPLTFQIVDIDMCDGRVLAKNPAIDPATGLNKSRPGMTQAGSTVRIFLLSLNVLVCLLFFFFSSFFRHLKLRKKN